MRRSYLAIISGAILLVILVLSWRGRISNPVFTGVAQPEKASPVIASQAAANAATAAPPSKPTASPTVTSDLRAVAERVRPAVVLISVFDEPGKLLRTGTGFFISEDGKFVTSRHFLQGGAHGVAKTIDGGIHNASGSLTEVAAADVAVLQAEVKKKVPFLSSGTAAGVNPGTPVALVGSALVRGASALFEATVAAQRSDQNGEWLELSSSPPNDMIGAPVVNQNGELLGVVTQASGQPGGAIIVRSAGALDLLVAKIDNAAKPRWQVAARTSPSPAGGKEEQATEGQSPIPRPTPKVATQTTTRTEKPRIVFNPKPQYPSYSYPRQQGSGTFRITFSPSGQAMNVETIKSTGSDTLDKVTLEALRKWKSTPGQQWSVTVPVTFEPR
jgi:TonB family protein